MVNQPIGNHGLGIFCRVRDYAVRVGYIRGISDLDANFGCIDMHTIYIYNTKDKLYILKLNGFERFPSELFTSTIVMQDFMRDESQARSFRNGSEC